MVFRVILQFFIVIDSLSSWCCFVSYFGSWVWLQSFFLSFFR